MSLAVSDRATHRAGLRNSPRKVVADVSSGRIEIGLPDGRYNVDVDVDSGEQRVDVPVDTTSDRLIQARASSGDIEIARNGR